MATKSPKTKTRTKKRKPEELDGTDRAIIQLILDNPVITDRELADRLGYSSHSWINERKNHPLVQKELKRLQAEVQTSAVQFIKSVQPAAAKELSRIAFGNMGDCFKVTADGIEIVGDVPMEQMALIQEVSETKTKDGGTIRVKMYSKLEALKTLLDGIPNLASGFNRPDGMADEEMQRVLAAADKVMKGNS